MNIKKKVESAANAVHFGANPPFRPAVAVNLEERSRELAKIALEANKDLVR